MSDTCYSCRCMVRLCILVWFALHLSFATQTLATTITVTNTNDSGPGSLRQALTAANDGDTINFAVTGTITLNSGGLPINKNITISGPSPDQLSVDGNQALLVFGVFPGKAATISGLTVMNAQSGILNDGTVTVTNCVLSGNSAATCGGVCGGVEIANTILNANASGNIDGIVTSHGYNISSDDGGGLLTGPGDQINTDPLLGPLRDHGGPTLTHMPMRGSPAIDVGDPSFTPPPDHDQRGACFLRVFGPRIDVGSVETQLRPRCVTPAPRPTP